MICRDYDRHAYLSDFVFQGLLAGALGAWQPRLLR